MVRNRWYLSILLPLLCVCVVSCFDEARSISRPENEEVEINESGQNTVEGTSIVITIKGEECSFANYAEYGCYIPPALKHVNGVLVLQHGCGMERFGITRSYDLQYRAFADKWGLAVIETALHGDCAVWHHPESGSAEAFMKVLDIVGLKTEHPELAEVPWLLFGHSSGGHWVLGMLRDYPEKILAAVCYSAAWDPQWDYTEAAENVPLLLRHAGKNDAPSCLCEATAIHTFGKLRKKNAPVAIAYNEGQNHNYSNVRHIAIPFFESAIKRRLTSRSGLRDVDKSGCYLADTLTLSIVKESEYEGDKSSMCRFLDKEIAEKWQEFVRTGDVADVTPPDAPYALSAVRLSTGGVKLTWHAEADVESGIECFNIYLDGKLVRRVPEEGTYQAFDRNGDNAIPAKPVGMTLIMTNEPESKFVLSVETVNQFGLSSKTASVTVKSK